MFHGLEAFRLLDLALSTFLGYHVLMNVIHVHIVNPPAPQALEILHSHLSPLIQLTSGPNLPNPARYAARNSSHLFFLVKSSVL